MDRRVLIKNLNDLFCGINKTGKKYSDVWLSDVDFGDMYQSDKYVLNVKAEHEIAACTQEIRDILKILNEKSYEELQSIWSVIVYDSKDEIHCFSDELLVFNIEKSCQ